MGVGYRPSKAAEGDDPVLSPSNHMVSGGASSAATRALCQPLDVLKIRLQLQLESGAGAKYRSLPHAFATILREEGAQAFWKGHLPAQALSVAYGVAQFASFEALTRSACALDIRAAEDGAWGPPAHFVCGAAAGAAATVTSYPFDVIRTRLVAQPGRRSDLFYAGSADAVRKMVTSEGPSALFRGMAPTFATIAPYSGLQFGFYNAFKRLLLGARDLSSSSEGISFSTSLVCGGLAGLCAKTAVYPFDTTKKRMQVSGFGRGRAALGRTIDHCGMLECMRTTVRGEGARGLFKGLPVALLKAVATTSINFALYEYCVEAIKLWKKQRQ